MGIVKPVGTPLSEGFADKERWVLAMQMGRLPNPCRVYVSICCCAFSDSVIPSPPYTCRGENIWC